MDFKIAVVSCSVVDILAFVYRILSRDYFFRPTKFGGVSRIFAVHSIPFGQRRQMKKLSNLQGSNVGPQLVDKAFHREAKIYRREDLTGSEN